MKREIPRANKVDKDNFTQKGVRTTETRVEPKERSSCWIKEKERSLKQYWKRRKLVLVRLDTTKAQKKVRLRPPS